LKQGQIYDEPSKGIKRVDREGRIFSQEVGKGKETCKGRQWKKLGSRKTEGRNIRRLEGIREEWAGKQPSSEARKFRVRRGWKQLSTGLGGHI